MNRASVSSGSPYEPIVGFARAVRIGNTIAIGGTAPIAPHGTNVGVGDPAVQARRCFEITREALEERGAGLENVIRTRFLLTPIDDWQAVAKVHGDQVAGGTKCGAEPQRRQPGSLTAPGLTIASDSRPTASRYAVSTATCMS